MKNTNFYFFITVFVVAMIAGCQKESAKVDSLLNAALSGEDELTAKWGKPGKIVHNGESIQAAIDNAKDGTTIFIEPGIYKEAITVSKPGIKLIGKVKQKNDEIIIQNPGEEEDGIFVSDEGDGFVLANVTVKDFEDNGVFLIYVENFTISAVKSVNNAEYGIFPVHCAHGLIEACTVTGSSDTGIYVGQSDDVRMLSNIAYANVNGLEIENSSNVTAAFNNSYNNVCGILVDVLPGKDVKTCFNISVKSNNVSYNNHINFGDTVEIEGTIPSGIGLLILGADNVIAENNIAVGNQFTGIVTFSTLVLSIIANIPPGDILSDIEPNPDNGKVARNYLHHNGFNPPVIPGLDLPGVDLLWDSSGVNNCWANNQFKTSAPSPLPSCN